MKLFGLTCDEATVICDKSQYGEASLWDKIKLNLHFAKCKFCKLYTKHNTFISSIINQNKSSLCDRQRNCLTEQEKQHLKKELEKFSA